MKDKELVLISIILLRALSAIVGLFLESNQSLFIFRSPVGLLVPEPSGASEPTVVVALLGGAPVVGHKHIFLVVPRPKKVEVPGVVVVTDRFQDHGVPLLESHVAHVFHCLHEGNRSSVYFLGCFSQVDGQGMLLKEVIAGEEGHAHAPSH